MVLSKALALQTELQLIVILAIRKHVKTLMSLLRFTTLIDLWLGEFCWLFWLKENTLNNTVCAKTALFNCLLFYSTGHMTQ